MGKALPKDDSTFDVFTHFPPSQPAKRRRVPVPHNGVDTSIEAARRVSRNVCAIHERVLAHLRQTGGSTCDEVEVALGLVHQNASARLWELRQMGLAEMTPEKRPTRRGTQAHVHRALDVR